MKTRQATTVKSLEEYSHGVKKEASNIETSKTEFTQFDPQTGKKLNTQTTTHQSKNTIKQQEWEKIKSQRSAQLIQFNQMSIDTAKIRSKVFNHYLQEIHNALIELEKLRQKLKLSYSDNSIWYSIDIVQLFVFGVTNDAYENKPIPDCFQYLICCWEWAELVAWGKDERMKNRLKNEYLLLRTTSTKIKTDQEMDLEALMQKETQHWFFIRSSMIAYHTLGCLLTKHIPKLDFLIRQTIRNHIQSDNFPVFKDLVIPEDDEKHPYNTVLLQYSFTLHIPLLSIPTKLAPFASMDGQIAISVDGPLTKLFGNHLSKQISEKFSLLALKNP